MAVVRVPEDGTIFTEEGDVSRVLSSLGLDWARLSLAPEVAAAPAADVLLACERDIAELKERGGYITADVIDVSPETPGLDAMLAKFSREHWHDEDEVRLIVKGSGIFHVRPKDGGPVVAIEVGAGDMLRVPAGTLHWFDLCATREIRAVRLFRDVSGWTPRYTERGTERGFQPVCLGPAHISASAV